MPGANFPGFGRVLCFPQLTKYQVLRFGPKKIRLNSLRSAFSTYSGSSRPSAPGLMEGLYPISRGHIPFCRAFHEFTFPLPDRSRCSFFAAVYPKSLPHNRSTEIPEAPNSLCVGSPVSSVFCQSRRLPSAGTC